MRLIDADELKKRVCSYNPVKYTYEYGDVISVEDIDNAPTIEAEPVRHGKWCKGWYTLYGTSTQHKVIICTECGFNFPDGGYLWDYCPRCGAKMDGGDV